MQGPACGAHVRAGSNEHAIALGDGSFVGFPTPCGKGRGCGNPLCTMSCIRRVSRIELLHWAGSSFEADGGTLSLPKDTAQVPHTEAALRAVHLLGRDGSLLFEDQPALLAQWATAGSCDHEARPSARASKRAGSKLGWEQWDARARANAKDDLAWLLQHPPTLAKHSLTRVCPICAAPARQPYRVQGEPDPYEGRVLLRWLEAGMALHPSSGDPIEDVSSVLWRLRAVVGPDVVQLEPPTGRTSQNAAREEATWALATVARDWLFAGSLVLLLIAVLARNLTFLP